MPDWNQSNSYDQPGKTSFEGSGMDKAKVCQALHRTLEKEAEEVIRVSRWFVPVTLIAGGVYGRCGGKKKGKGKRK